MFHDFKKNINYIPIIVLTRYIKLEKDKPKSTVFDQWDHLQKMVFSFALLK